MTSRQSRGSAKDYEFLKNNPDLVDRRISTDNRRISVDNMTEVNRRISVDTAENSQVLNRRISVDTLLPESNLAAEFQEASGGGSGSIRKSHQVRKSSLILYGILCQNSFILLSKTVGRVLLQFPLLLIRGEM